jgi:hypothetical protein
MTKQETDRLLAYDNAKRNRPRTVYNSRRTAKSARFSAPRFQLKQGLRKRFVLSTEVLGIS